MTMDGPIKLRTNEYWGKRSGTITRDGQCIIKGKRAGAAKAASGGAGRGDRRRNRTYANKKLSRPSRAGSAVPRTKGRKAMGRAA